MGSLNNVLIFICYDHNISAVVCSRFIHVSVDPGKLFKNIPKGILHPIFGRKYFLFGYSHLPSYFIIQLFLVPLPIKLRIFVLLGTEPKLTIIM